MGIAEAVALVPPAFFWQRVKKLDSGCWEWTGSISGDYSYGYIFHKKKDRQAVGNTTTLAHRFSYFMHKGYIPVGMLVMHTCDYPRCVNPDHLVLGTLQDNAADMMTKGRCAVGSSRWNSKLTDVLVREMRARVSSGESLLKVSKEYAEKVGVGRQTICHAVRRETWKHVP